MRTLVGSIVIGQLAFRAVCWRPLLSYTPSLTQFGLSPLRGLLDIDASGLP